MNKMRVVPENQIKDHFISVSIFQELTIFSLHADTFLISKGEF